MTDKKAVVTATEIAEVIVAALKKDPRVKNAGYDEHGWGEVWIQTTLENGEMTRILVEIPEEL